MALAHQIGEDLCTIFSQDISQRSNKMLKLNLILNNLVFKSRSCNSGRYTCKSVS